MRSFNRLDSFFEECQNLLQNVYGKPAAQRENPAKLRVDQELTPNEIRQSQGFMRVNHTGEICAQALYRGQAFATANSELKSHLQEAATEEADHLAWCKEHLDELQTHTSHLNLFWYSASFLIGFAVAKKNDATSLGFVEETEKQVVQHLEHHTKHLSKLDHKSRAIISVMREDEQQHGQAAREKGAVALPQGLKTLMQLQSKVMTTTAYWV